MKLSNFAGLTLAALGLVVLSGVQANAQVLTGSFGFSLNGTKVFPAGDNFTTGTGISATKVVTNGTATGDFVTPIDNTGTGNLGVPTDITFANPNTFGFSTVTYGSFVASGVPVVIVHTATAYTVDLFGTFTPGTYFPAGKLPTQVEVEIAYTLTGASVSGSGTLSANPTPEPGAVAMLVGMGISGSAFAFRRVRRSK